jgi:hypothetical protein
MGQSQRWTLNSADVIHIAKVLGWSLVSAVIGFLLSQLPLLDVPAKYAVIASLLVPFVNTILVAAQKFVAGKTQGGS